MTIHKLIAEIDDTDLQAAEDITASQRRLDLLEDLRYSLKETRERCDAILRFESGVSVDG